MILDKFLEFSDAQAVTATAISTNVVDLYPLGGNASRDIGNGENIYLIVRTLAAATDVGSDATLTVTLESSNAEALSASTVHFSTGALAFATFSPAGTELARFKLPGGNYLRYLGVRYTVANGPLTGGTFDAFIVKDDQAYRSYAVGSTIV
ncbi:MAG TPA: hypothetical protein VLH79_15580 [Chthonomonadales bacterium]|nr:hypothetical protein [Chthonomonadales bacterium]